MSRDEQIERYLLGRLSEEELTRLESGLFSDDAVFDEIGQAEERLIERYLRDELSTADRRAFEAHFAASPLRQERIAFHRSLLALAAEESAAAPPPERQTPARGSRRRVAAWAGLAAGAVLLTGLAVWGLQEATPSGPVLRLHGGTLREGGETPRLAVAEGTSAVALEAVLPSAAAGGPFRASLRTVEGDVVWRGDAPSRNAIATVTVPRDRLRPGDYVLTLEAGTGTAPGSYFFRVIR